MDPEEYRTIRDEMLRRFGWTYHLLIFAIAATGALLSWLSQTTNLQLDPYPFICVGLGVIGIVFYSYVVLLQGIYNMGGYLAMFHDVHETGFRWHWLSRLRNELIGNKSDWGRDGKRGGWILIILAIANIAGPLWILRVANITTRPGTFFEWVYLLRPDGLEWVTFWIAVGIGCRMGKVLYDLFNTAEFMRENMQTWRQIKVNVEEKNDLPEEIFNALVGKVGPNVEKVLEKFRDKKK